MTVAKLFATPVQTTNLDILDSSNSEIKQRCLQKKIESTGRTLSNKGGWQSHDLNNTDLNTARFRELFFKIKEEVNVFFEVMGIVDHGEYINSWINVNNSGDFNNTHTHPNSIVSGVYYVSVPNDSGELVFTRPSDLTSWFYSSYSKEFNDVSKNFVIHTPVEKELVLFPSWLPHCVTANNSNTERISISFNYNARTFKFGTS